jgi:hypothetical protein
VRSNFAIGTGVVVSGFLLALAASGKESAEESEYVGAAHCAQCHANEYAQWKQGPHARALEVLSDAERANPQCRQCHTTTPEDTDPALAGVQCEACHGRGRYYSTRWVMRDPELRQAMFFDRGGPGTCGRCHNDLAPNIEPFDYEKKMALIRHGPTPLAGASAPFSDPAP